jgi:hypothetical protein
VWKGVLVFALGVVGGLYSTFVLTIMWNWFVVPALHLSEISFWMAFGLILVINLLRDPRERDMAEDQKWEALTTMLEACVPEDRKAYVKERLESQSKGIWMKAGVTMFSLMVGNTAVLGMGFVVHIFAS